jgi:hypothetical protein
MNYQVMEMKFNATNDKKVVLRGMSNGGPKIVSNKSVEAILRHRDVTCALECLIIAQEDSGDRQHHHAHGQTLLSKRDHVFGQIPLGRSSNKGFEHTIELEEGGKPMITTPYRHPKKFKDEIEKSIKELLEMGHIRSSSSPFVFFVVLVKKKDGTMRMSINYISLNENAIKNIYPIPRIDELLDKLHGDMYFLKIDPRSGHHHIKVREQDIPKTTFRCHYGNYEFFFMSFGLTNAPSSFQSYMNHIFKK